MTGTPGYDFGPHFQRFARGDRLREGICDIARRHAIPLLVTGFGFAFALHFTAKAELRDYRDTLEDDRAAVERCLYRALQSGLHLIPDGRLYVSAAHTEEELDETLSIFERVLKD